MGCRAQLGLLGSGNDGMGMGRAQGCSIQVSQYGQLGSMGTYGRFPGGPPMGHHPLNNLNSTSLGGPGFSSVKE
jgi:hypothetical protein